ncbi:MAG: glucose dehydrogenase, partial [Pseudomonadota bacterium]|nr:glucose dehydrogenase [Pseudomonadota bacterium]
NPWRFSFDGGRIAIADVGGGLREEVNFLTRAAAIGANFGWPRYEGSEPLSDFEPGPGDPPFTFPMLAYDHSGDRCSIIGGYVVRDPELPMLKGRYLYGDFCTGEVRSFAPDVANQQALRDRPAGVANLDSRTLTSFGQGFNGQIYIAQTSGAAGSVSRLEPVSP